MVCHLCQKSTKLIGVSSLVIVASYSASCDSEGVANKMADSWIEFFYLVNSFLREAELKDDTTSIRVIECVSEKLEYCIRNITKIDDTIQEAIIQAQSGHSYQNAPVCIHIWNPS